MPERGGEARRRRRQTRQRGGERPRAAPRSSMRRLVGAGEMATGCRRACTPSSSAGSATSRAISSGGRPSRAMPVSRCSIAGARRAARHSAASAAIWPRSLSTGISRPRANSAGAARHKPVQHRDLGVAAAARRSARPSSSVATKKSSAAARRERAARPAPRRAHRHRPSPRRRSAPRADARGEAAANWRRWRRDRSRGSSRPRFDALATTGRPRCSGVMVIGQAVVARRKLSKRVVSWSKRSVTLPIGPWRCLAIDAVRRCRGPPRAALSSARSAR